MAPLLIQPLPLEKEGWNTVHEVVQKSLQMVSTNMSSIKRWADRADDKLQALTDHNKTTQTHLDALDASLEGTQERLQALTDDVNELRAQSNREFETFASCINKLLDSTLLFYELFVQSFDPQDLLRHEQRATVMDGDHSDELDVLMYLSSKLDDHLLHIPSAFDNWRGWRRSEQEKSDMLKCKVGELLHASEQTRERLLAWRELLRDSQQTTGTLRATLESHEDSIRQMQSLKVTSDEVYGIVGERTQKLEELHDVSKRQIETVRSRLEAHAEQITKCIGDVNVDLHARLDGHSSSLKQLLENALNPVNAYLNNIHVKTNVVRVDLDQVRSQVPILRSLIEEVSSRLDGSDMQSRERDKNLNASLDDFARKTLEILQRSEHERIELSDALSHNCGGLNERVSELQTRMGSTSQALDAVKNEELSSLGTNLASLEQKVAKWVHCSQLPAKMSEARLFALESKLADEMECRLHLEEAVKERGPSRETSAPSRSPLPTLPSSRPSTQGRPRSKASPFFDMSASPSERMSGVFS